MVLAAEHHLKIYPGVRDHAAKVAQFVKKSSLVISIYSQSKCKNIVDPDQLASPKPAYLDLQCLQRQDIFEPRHAIMCLREINYVMRYDVVKSDVIISRRA